MSEDAPTFIECLGFHATLKELAKIAKDRGDKGWANRDWPTIHRFLLVALYGPCEICRGSGITTSMANDGDGRVDHWIEDCGECYGKGYKEDHE